MVNDDLSVCSFNGALPHAAGSLLPFVFNERMNKCPALPDSSVGFNPFKYQWDNPLLKGLKPTEEEALPPILLTVS